MSDEEYSSIVPGHEFYWVGAHKYGYPPIVVIAKQYLENDYKPDLYQWYFKVPDRYHAKIGFDIGEYVRIEASELYYGPNTGMDQMMEAYEALFDQLVKEGKFYFGLFETITSIHELLLDNHQTTYQYLHFKVGSVTYMHKGQYLKRLKNILTRIDSKVPPRVLELKQAMLEQKKANYY